MVGGEELLRLEGVTKTYPGLVRPVLRGVDLTVRASETLAILGPSGCGKSTLLSIAGSLEVPDAGRVLVDGVDLAELSPEELARLRNADLGFVFQRHHLLPQCTALENVLVPTLAAPAEERGAPAEARAAELLARVGLAERTSHLPSQLSGGERQRVAVVRALVRRPRLLFLDEPTGALDERSAAALGDLLLELNASEGVALVMVTHARDLARRMATSLELHEGVLSRSEDARPATSGGGNG